MFFFFYGVRNQPQCLRMGYNTIQLMAVAEHAFYGSFGYHVTNYFAPSSRCGTPEALKRLVDEAHALGMVVIMDLVHAHCSSNSWAWNVYIPDMRYASTRSCDIL